MSLQHNAVGANGAKRAPRGCTTQASTTGGHSPPDGDQRHAALWTAIDFIRSDLADLKSTVRGAATKSMIVTLLPWAAWLVMATASQCSDRPMPQPPMVQR